jgi:hypothetical protein
MGMFFFTVLMGVNMNMLNGGTFVSVGMRV